MVESVSVRGDGVDFTLGEKGDDSLPNTNINALLEVSGILRGTRGQVNARLREKETQVQKSAALKVPKFILVAEFSRPIVKSVKK